MPKRHDSTKTKASPVEVRWVKPAVRVKTEIEGDCPLCGKLMPIGTMATVKQGRLMHREGDPRCTSVVAGRGR